MNITSNKKNFTIGTCLLLILLAVSYLSIFSMYTSPLFNIYPESDSDIFIMMEKMFREGYTPYLDFFDHKGPSIIFIQALGLSFLPDERSSIFILQCVNLFVTLLLVFKTASYFLNKRNSLIVVIFTLIILGFSLPSGNYTEEWCLPFLFLALLFCIQFFLSKATTFSKWKSFILGISFGMIFWLRMNNASVICAAVMYIFLIQVKYKDWNSVRNLILFFTAGFLVITLPIIIYFIQIDAYQEMIYATFTFNFKYASMDVGKYNSPIAILLKSIISESIPFIVLLVGSIVYYNNTKKKSIFLLTTLLIFWGIISTQIGSAFDHYMILNTPLFTLGVTLILSEIKLLNKHPLVIGAFALGILFLFSAYRVHRDKTNDINKSIADTRMDILKAYDFIPTDEKDQIYAYHMPNYFYLVVDLLPSKICKYFIYQEGHGMHEPDIFKKINNMIVKEKPKWVFARTFNTTWTENIEIYDIFEEQYTPIYQTETFTLYKYNSYKGNNTR